MASCMYAMYQFCHPCMRIYIIIIIIIIIVIIYIYIIMVIKISIALVASLHACIRIRMQH